MSVLREIHDSLRTGWQTLESQWQSVVAQWRDSVAARFEKEFWQPMEGSMPRLLRTMDEVEETFRQAFRSLDE